MSSEDEIRTLLTETRTWAVVGCSPDPSRDSHRIARVLQQRGFRVIPVNPTVGGDPRRALLPVGPAYHGGHVEVVDIFRRADRAGAHVDEAIGISARGLDAARRDRPGCGAAGAAAGLLVVMDRCPAIELPRLVAR